SPDWTALMGQTQEFSRNYLRFKKDSDFSFLYLLYALKNQKNISDALMIAHAMVLILSGPKTSESQQKQPSKAAMAWSHVSTDLKALSESASSRSPQSPVR